eukprot:gene21564-22460_t
MHNGVFNDVRIFEDDAIALRGPHDSNNVGLIHGDLNVSNFFIQKNESEEVLLSVFDWDQVQWAWFEYDIAQSLLACLMVAEGGLPPAGSPVPEADLSAVQQWMVAGYEAVRGPGSVDRDRLGRMLRLRKEFYGLFCRRAEQEGDIPKDMEWLGQHKPEDIRGRGKSGNLWSMYDVYHSQSGPASIGPLLLIHGGYWRAEYDRGHLRPLAIYFASVGWEVALAEYRREPGLQQGQGPGLGFELDSDNDPSSGEIAPTASVSHLVRGVVALAPVADLKGGGGPPLGVNGGGGVLGAGEGGRGGAGL